MKFATTILIVILLASCKTKTQSVDTLNLPEDSLSFYFPANIFSDRPSSDSFVQNWYSSALYSFKEPVLSQSFIGHNIYRFLWLRSFHRPVVFTLRQKDNQVWLTTKILDKQPMFHDDRFGANVSILPKEEQQEYIDKGYSINKKTPDHLVFEKKADRKANIIYNKQIFLSVNEWNEFEQFLLKANFWTLPTNIDDGSTDGAQWVLEGHLKDKYHVVNYHSPGNNEYAKAGLFLIKLSGLKEEIY